MPGFPSPTHEAMQSGVVAVAVAILLARQCVGGGSSSDLVEMVAVSGFEEKARKGNETHYTT